MNTPTPTPEEKQKIEKTLSNHNIGSGSWNERLIQAVYEYADLHHASKMKERVGMPPMLPTETEYRDFRDNVCLDDNQKMASVAMWTWLKSGNHTGRIMTAKTRNALDEKVFTALGAVSMCWSETPKGEFESSRARLIGIELMNEIYATVFYDKYNPNPLPVSLPTNEEIEDAWLKMINPSVSVGFVNGAKWMRDKWSSSLTGQQEGWISVDKELPKIDSNVLCLFKNGRQDVCKYTKVFQIEFVENCICVTEQITHWQPLPPAPTNQ